MPQGITEIQEILKSWLNPSIFTLDSAEGVIVIGLCVIIVYRITKNLKDFVGWCIGLLFIIQLGHVLGFTVLNNYFPFRDIFKFDVLAAPAQLFAGTRFADWILYIDAFMQYIAKVLTETFIKLFPSMQRLFDAVFETMPWQG